MKGLRAHNIAGVTARDEVAERVAEGRFYVWCVDQFKRGQSTVLKALIGAEVLPTQPIPVRAVPGIIRLMKVTPEPAQVAANLESIRNS